MPSRSTRTSLALGAALLVLMTNGVSREARAETSPAEIQVDAALYRAPAEGGVRRWRVATGAPLPLLRRPADPKAATTTVDDGAVLANLGCAPEAGVLWCAVRPFRGGPRGFAPADALRPAEGPDGVTPMGVDDSKQRARRREFDAAGEIACAQERGQSLDTCAAAVARGAGGDATVVVTFPNGFKRELYFAHGAFVSASATMSGVGRDTDWRLDDGAHRIRVDDQRYVLPATLLFGEGPG